MADNTGEQITTQERSVANTKQEILKEAKRIEESALFSAKGHFVAAAFWSGFHLWIGVPTAVLAAIAATSAFTNYAMAAGVVSIMVAGLSALTAFLNPNEKAATHLNAGNSYDSLQNRVRIFWAIDCWREQSEQVLTERLKDFSEEKDKLNRSSPQPPGWAYRRAKKGIEAGEADYRVDNANRPRGHGAK